MNEVYFRYFSDLMANSFREIIEFSKNIPGFKKLDLNDQIALIKGSCVEMLFIKVKHKKLGHSNRNILYLRQTIHFQLKMKHFALVE